jgi:hypothetical protein
MRGQSVDFVLLHMTWFLAQKGVGEEGPARAAAQLSDCVSCHLPQVSLPEACPRDRGILNLSLKDTPISQRNQTYTVQRQ